MIFDVFRAGSVPIYWGAPNVARYIPQNCYIARENFSDNAQLYDYLSKMDEKKYHEYLQNIKQYLESEQAKSYSIDNFVNLMMSLISSKNEPSDLNGILSSGK